MYKVPLILSGKDIRNIVFGRTQTAVSVQLNRVFKAMIRWQSYPFNNFFVKQSRGLSPLLYYAVEYLKRYFNNSYDDV